MASCGECGRPIFFAVTKNDRLIPVDVATSVDGNVEITPTVGDGPPLATVHAQSPMLPTGTLHHTHFATCPRPEGFRRPRPTRAAIRSRRS